MGDGAGILRADAGAVHVFYGQFDLGGSGSGLSSAGTDFWHQDISGIPDSVEAGDRFGYALVAGNFNGDRYEDLAIAVPFEQLGTTAGVGVVHILYGSSLGLTTAGTQLVSQAAPEVREAGDHFGLAVTSGNFNGDGRTICPNDCFRFPVDDLAVGAPDEDIGAAVDAGAVQVFFGSTNGLVQAGSQVWHQNVGTVANSSETGDRFGLTLTSGYFNAGTVVGNFADLAIGVPFEDFAFANDGVVQVLYGTATGLSDAGNQIWHQNRAGIADANEPHDHFGLALAVGDFDNDLLADLAIGVPDEDIGTTANAGIVHVLYGAAAALTATGAQLWSQNSTGIVNIAEANDRFVQALVAQDFNADGRADLAVGVPNEDLAFTNDGVVHVLYGLNASGLAATGNELWFQNAPGIVDVSEAEDGFGFSLAAGDFDRNSAADLSVGVPGEDLGVSASKRNAGLINVIYGIPAAGLDRAHNQAWHQDSAGVPDVAEANDRFGHAQ